MKCKEVIYRFLEECEKNEWSKFFARRREIKIDNEKFEFWIPIWRRYALFTKELRRKYKECWKDINEYLKIWNVFIEQYRGRRLYIKCKLKQTRFYVAWFTGSTYKYPRCIYLHYYNPFFVMPDNNHGYWLLEQVCKEILGVDFEEIEEWHNFRKEPETRKELDYYPLRLGLKDMEKALQYIAMKKEIELDEGEIHISGGWTGVLYDDFPFVKDGKIWFDWYYVGVFKDSGFEVISKGLVSVDGEVKIEFKEYKYRRKGVIEFDITDKKTITRILKELEKYRKKMKGE